ncbi:MAG: PAS domain S-box protein [Scytonematopsis contorta HA4267-MV1]|jgi:PAS domain S-box-containing protein|nr:PAS domain S-box protein [Scytonematopsis contorta HA4267-MV1]
MTNILQALLSSTSDAIFVKDLQGRYVIANEIAAEYFGTTVEAMLGKDDVTLFPADIAQQIIQNDERIIRTGESCTYEEKVSHQGITRWLLSKKHPWCDDDDSIVGIIGIIQDITENKKNQEALQLSEEGFRLATAAAELGMWFWDLTTDELVWTPKCKALFGLTVDTQISYQLFLNCLHPDDREFTDEAVSCALAQKTIYDVEYRTVWPDGSLHWIAAKGRATYDVDGNPVRMMGTVQDISDRKQVEENLRQSELNFRTLADTMPQMFWTTQADGFHDYFNKRWCEYTGMTLKETQGWGWSHLLHPDDKQRCLDIWNESLSTGKDYYIEYRFRRASDGQYHWFIGQAFPLRDEGGKILKWFGSCTDIHDKKRTEEALRDSLQKQKAAYEEAEKANRIKDEFLAVLSHELRTPLNPILGWAKIIKRGNLNPGKMAEALEIIERNAKLQAQLIEDLLDVSRILQGKLTLNIDTVNLKSVILAALETVRLTAEVKNIKIQTVLADTSMVSGDGGRLQQVFWNLLSNAVKFTPKAGRVEITLEEVQDYAKITITDTGKGISADFLPWVFDYFRQADSATTRKFGGLGLGLAIVRQITEMHGGTVKAESLGENLGASFTVKLPLFQAISREDESEEGQVDSNSQNLLGVEILVVDDDIDSRDFIAFVLEMGGATVTQAASALEALQKLTEFKPDIIVSDIGMPEMDGYMLMRQIRNLQSEEIARIPAVAVTAYAGEYDYQQALSAGFQKHVSKPVEPDELVAVVTQLLGERL